MKRILLLAALFCAALSAQVYPDFPLYIPAIKSGSVLPVRCQGGRGEVFLLTADLKFYVCSSTDQWSAIGGGGGTLSSAGTGLQVSGATLSVDPAVVATYLTGSGSLTFGSMATGACSTAQTFTLTGASTGDSIAPGWPSSLEVGLVGLMRVSALNTIEVRLCNLSGSTMTPSSGQTFRATIVRSF